MPARYGTGSSNGRGAVNLEQAAHAWQKIAALVYSRPPDLAGFGAKSVIEVRPPQWFQDTCARVGFQPSAIHYQTGALRAPAATLLAATSVGAPQADLPEAFLYDVVDVTRQVLTDAAIAIIDSVLAASKKCGVARMRGGRYKAQQDAAGLLLHRRAARLRGLLADFDRLLGSHRRWQAGWR